MNTRRRTFLAMAGTAGVAASLPVSAAAARPALPLLRPHNVVTVFEKGKGLIDYDFGDRVVRILEMGERYFSNYQRVYRVVSHDSMEPEQLVNAFAKQTAFLEYVSMFPDHIIQDLHKAALANRMDGVPPRVDYGYEQYFDECVPPDYQDILDKNPDQLKLLRSLTSRQAVRDYIQESRKQFEDLMQKTPTDAQFDYEPLGIKDIEVFFGQYDFSASYFELSAASHKPGVQIDWTDKKSLNYRIEKEFLEMYGVHLNRYSMAPDIQRFMNANRDSVIQRYKESQNKRWLENEQYMVPEANPRKPFLKADIKFFADYQGEFEACLDELNGRNYPSWGRPSYKPRVLGNHLFAETLSDLRKTEVKETAPKKARTSIVKRSKKAMQTELASRVMRRALLTLWEATMEGHGITADAPAEAIVSAPQAVPAITYAPEAEMPVDMKAPEKEKATALRPSPM